MRIVSGKWKGRQLVSFKADHIRPTTDRVKESVFNTLQGELEGARVLDLFSGTGNLSFESISRGARQVVAVEISKKSIAIIHKNVEALAVGDELVVHNEDVLKFLRQYQGEPFDLIFADPPFTEALSHSVLQALASSRVVAAHSTVVIESAKREQVDEEYEGSERTLVRSAKRDFGDKFVSYFVLRA